MSFDVVCFDCDSTLSCVEGIDELARRAGLFDKVAALTELAMNGEVTLQEVYENRLTLIKPDKTALDWLAQLYINEVVPGARDTIAALVKQKKPVHIVSGGLRQAILPLAEFLGVPPQQVHAVDVWFDEQGAYLGFAKDSPLAKSGGKGKICQQIMNKKQTVAMIGDGKTDLEARQAGATVIGFGGVVARDAVKQQADFFVSEPSLLGVLDFLL